METPAYYLPIMPYLMVQDAPAFLQFTKTVFDAEERLIVPREDGSGCMEN